MNTIAYIDNGTYSTVSSVTYAVVTDGTRYTITESDGQTTSDMTGVSFTIDGELNGFKSLWIDNVLVPPTNYIVSSGATDMVLTLNNSSPLGLGKHTIKAVFEDGYASGTFDTDISSVATSISGRRLVMTETIIDKGKSVVEEAINKYRGNNDDNDVPEDTEGFNWALFWEAVSIFQQYDINIVKSDVQTPRIDATKWMRENNSNWNGRIIATYDIRVGMGPIGRQFCYLTRFDEPIDFEVTIPEVFIPNNNDVKRSFYLLRYHKGIIDKIPVEKVRDKEYRARSDRFSEFTLVYEDSVVTDAGTTTNTTTSTNNNSNSSNSSQETSKNTIPLAPVAVTSSGTPSAMVTKNVNSAMNVDSSNQVSQNDDNVNKVSRANTMTGDRKSTLMILLIFSCSWMLLVHQIHSVRLRVLYLKVSKRVSEYYSRRHR